MSLELRKILVPVAILALGALGVAAQLATRATPESRPPQLLVPMVRVVEVRPEVHRFTVHAQGTVVPRTESDLIPQVAGEVVWVSPALVSGGFFEADQLLMRIDPADFRSAHEGAKASLARARSEEARARKELERQQRLMEHGVASEARIDDALNQHRVAEAVVREARVRRDDALRNLARTEIRSSYAGRVRSKSVDVGQFVSRGAPVARLYAVDWAEVRLPIPDRELRYLDVPLTYRPRGEDAETGEAPEQSGPAVRLRAEFAGEEHEWQGRVVRTEGEIDPRSRMVTLVARVEDPYAAGADRRPPLAVGLFVQAEIAGIEVRDAFVLPRSALHRDAQLLVLGDDDRLELRAVEVLRMERERVVIGAGLVAGERVCLTPLPGAIDGMRVRTVQAGGQGTDAVPERARL